MGDAWYNRLADTSATVTTSPAAMGAIGALIGATSSKAMESHVKDIMAARGGVAARLRHKLVKRVVAKRRADPKFVALSMLIGGATGALGATAGRLVHGRALEHRLRRGKAWTPSEKRMLKRWENG